jgi:thiol-disulfide isomerase/thioredoxin
VSSRVQKKASAREKAARIRAEQLRAERRRRLLVAGAAVTGVLIIVIALVVAKLAGVSETTAAAPTGKASAGVVSALSSVPASVFDQVGTSKADGEPKKIDAPALTAGGKPRVLYVGAEFCPYCAAERWPMAVALARFGSFTGLGSTASASDDVFPKTPTLSFHGASYTSQYLAFTGVETTTNKKVGGSYQALDNPSSADQKIMDTYNQPPYVSGQGGAIPFVDIGGTYVSAGATYSPQLLAGKTHAQVAAALKDPTSAIAQAVDGSANLFTAAICQVTGNKPGNVCTSAGVTGAAASLGKS